MPGRTPASWSDAAAELVRHYVGERISDLTLSRTGQPIDPTRSYVVTGWGSLNEGVEGPPVWDVLAQHLKTQKTVKGIARGSVTIKRG